MISYVLVMRNDRKVIIEVGSLGSIEFGSGYYYYVGSAKVGLKRVMRHFTSEKKQRWHIDYISTKFRVVGAVIVKRDECEVANAIREKGLREIPGFGSSDCSCTSHLFHSTNLILEFLSA